MTGNKVLVVTYYWPPAGGPGVQRWLKFAKYLGEFGIIPVIARPINPNYPTIDSALNQDIPDDLEVLALPIFEPARIMNQLMPARFKSISRGMVTRHEPGFIERLLLSIRGNLFIPDARKFWVNPTVKYLKKYLNEHPEIKLVITTGPPHSVHLIGQKLKQSCAVKWMADFRDPWTEIYYHKALNLTRWAHRRHLHLEQTVLETADKIITTSPTTAKAFRLRTSRDVSVITNGYDAADFIGLIPDSLDTDNKFRISHVGTLMDSRNPRALWQALENLIENNHELDGLEDFSNDLEIELTGSVAQGVIDAINDNGLDQYCSLYPNCSHSEAIMAMARGHLLLLCERNEADAYHIIPAKLFEYIALSKPILAIGPEQSAIESILENTDNGTYAKQGDVKIIEHQLYKAYRAFKSKSYKKGTVPDQPLYARKNLTQSLATMIKEILQ